MLAVIFRASGSVPLCWSDYTTTDVGRGLSSSVVMNEGCKAGILAGSGQCILSINVSRICRDLEIDHICEGTRIDRPVARSLCTNMLDKLQY